MKEPNVRCPSCKVVQHLTTRDDFVVICGIIYEQYEAGKSNFENYTVTPIHCEDDHYLNCTVWRNAVRKDWVRKAGEKYSSHAQAEKIRI